MAISSVCGMPLACIRGRRGRLPPIVGTFAPRQFSTRNPLIGTPDGYSLEYPLAVEVSGELRHFDYRAAMVSLPASHMNYVPMPTPAAASGDRRRLHARHGIPDRRILHRRTVFKQFI